MMTPPARTIPLANVTVCPMYPNSKGKSPPPRTIALGVTQAVARLRRFGCTIRARAAKPAMAIINRGERQENQVSRNTVSKGPKIRLKGGAVCWTARGGPCPSPGGGQGL